MSCSLKNTGLDPYYSSWFEEPRAFLLTGRFLDMEISAPQMAHWIILCIEGDPRWFAYTWTLSGTSLEWLLSLSSSSFFPALSPAVLCTVPGAAYRASHVIYNKILQDTVSSQVLILGWLHMKITWRNWKTDKKQHLECITELDWHICVCNQNWELLTDAIWPLLISQNLRSVSLLASSAQTTLTALLFLAHGELISGSGPFWCLEFSSVLVQNSHPHFLHVLT